MKIITVILILALCCSGPSVIATELQGEWTWKTGYGMIWVKGPDVTLVGFEQRFELDGPIIIVNGNVWTIMGIIVRGERYRWHPVLKWVPAP